MGRDEKFIDFFLGIGIRSFSVDPHFLPFMRDSINAIRVDEAAAMAGRLLRCATIGEAERIIASGEETT
jgi:phosphoenolpyruvate-protein kinase (PTS system EI component)